MGALDASKRGMTQLLNKRQFTRDLLIRYREERYDREFRRLRKVIIGYLEASAKTKDESEALDYIRNNKLSNYLPNHSDKYKSVDVQVYRDSGNGLRYVLHKGKRMFFGEGMTDKELANYYRGLLGEQDPQSPHYYFSCGAEVHDGDVIVDIGAAEGIFALDVVERAGRIYVIEGDPSWIKALEETFKPWMGKVKIIPKYVSDVDNEQYATLDRLFDGEKINFIKMDIEGFEEKVLRGAENLLSSNKELTVVACAYHSQQSERGLREILVGKGFSVSTSSGYILFTFAGELQPPYLRRGLVVGRK